jgi:hypothetical protein
VLYGLLIEIFRSTVAGKQQAIYTDIYTCSLPINANFKILIKQVLNNGKHLAIILNSEIIIQCSAR